MKIENYFKEHQNEFLQSEKMSEASDILFEQKLKYNLHSTKSINEGLHGKTWGIAASIAVLLTFGFWFVSSNSSDAQFEEMLLADLTNESAGKRLEGVYNFNETYKREDDRILNRLIEIVLNDDNANVQIASIDALLQFPKNEEVRRNLIKALEKENKPIVQIKLIKAIQILRDKRAQESLEKIIENEQTFPIVKNNATLAMASLKNK